MKAIIHHNVESSMIKSVGFDPDNDVIEVKFHNNKVYKYKGSEDDFEGLRCAGSCGKHFNEHFRGKAEL